MDIHKFYEELTQEEKLQIKEKVTLEFERNLGAKLAESVTHCPNCKHTQFQKVGKTRGIQRYKCKFCNKTFNAKTKTAFHCTKKSLETWNHYLNLMFSNQMSLRKIAKATGIDLRTTFFWRHKILNALKELDNPKLSGIVEADETYFALSYKGKKRDLPRPPHKRGKQIKKRGLSKDQVCVIGAIDRTKSTLLESTCLASPKISDITRVLGPHIARDALLVTDFGKAFPGFARNLDLKHYPLEKRTSDNESIHRQTVNSLHAQVKRFMRPFNGVATKYLDHYMTYYKWSGQDADETAADLAQSTASVTCSALTAMQMRLK